MTSINRPSGDCTFETSEIDEALRCLESVGFCVIKKMIDSLPEHLKQYADGYTGYDGSWRGAT